MAIWDKTTDSFETVPIIHAVFVAKVQEPISQIAWNLIATPRLREFIN